MYCASSPPPLRYVMLMVGPGNIEPYPYNIELIYLCYALRHQFGCVC